MQLVTRTYKFKVLLEGGGAWQFHDYSEAVPYAHDPAKWPFIDYRSYRLPPKVRSSSWQVP